MNIMFVVTMFMNHDGDAHGIQNENVVVGICQCNVDSGSELTALIMATTLLVITYW